MFWRKPDTASGSEFQISSSQFRNSDLQLRISGFGFRVLGFGFRVSGFGSRAHSEGNRAHDLPMQDPTWEELEADDTQVLQISNSIYKKIEL